MLKTSNHILTSRASLNTLSYDVQMEITGFIDENIQYVRQFFNQIKDELDSTIVKNRILLHNHYTILKMFMDNLTMH